MSLSFCNRYPEVISVCIVLQKPLTCPDGGGWFKAGWWNLNPGDCKAVTIGNLRNRFYYFFAQAMDGAVWAGERAITVTHQPFQSCINVVDADASLQVGLREIDTGEFLHFTMNLVQ